MGVAMVRGREFSARDTVDSPRVAVISQSLAAGLFPAGDAVGRLLSIGDDPARRNLEIVGVAHNARFGDPHGYAPRIVYLPVFQDPGLLEYGVLEVRAVGSPGSVIPAVEARIRQLGREFPSSAGTLSAAIDFSLAEERLMASLSTFFGAVALFLALIGLYGLQAYAVSRRVREFGLRMALGADSRRIFRVVLREALVLLAAGVAVGLPLALGASRILASRLPGLTAGDPVPLAIAAGLLAVAGLAAACVPAWRAARIDAMEALRSE